MMPTPATSKSHNVGPDPEAYAPRKTPDELEALAKGGLKMSNYDGMMPEMAEGAMVVDDISHVELERLIEAYRPALFRLHQGQVRHREDGRALQAVA